MVENSNGPPKDVATGVGHFWKTVGMVGLAGPLGAVVIAGVFSLIVYQRGQVALGPFTVQKTTPRPAATSIASGGKKPTAAPTASLAELGQQICQEGDIRFAGPIVLHLETTSTRDADNGCLPA